MKNTKQSNRPRLLTLRFSGRVLQAETLPVYELGSALIGVQRMIHKAYIEDAFAGGRDTGLPRRVRERLALQIGDRRRGSDIYDLTTFLKLADASPTVSALIAHVLGAASAYVAKEVVRYLVPTKAIEQTRHRRAKKRDNDGKRLIAKPVAKDAPLAVSIFNDIRLITDRIGSVGGVSEIELTSPTNKQLAPVVLTRDTRDYVRHIADAVVLGEYQELGGIVIKWDTRTRTVDIQRIGASQCKVFLDAKEFVDVRYKPRPKDVVIFVGHPMYCMGSDLRRFNRFRAEKFIIPKHAG